MNGNVITNPHGNIPKNKKSHTLGWSKIWSELLNAEINHKCDKDILNYEKVYIDHGVNFGGSLNLFGGANEELFNKFNTLMKKDPSYIYSLDRPMPDFGKMLKGRLKAKTTFSGIDEEWCNKLSEFCKYVSYIDHKTLICSTEVPCTLGDSHSLAFSKKNDIVIKRNGRTLEGALNKGLINYLDDISPDRGVLTLCLGSIDIRHHICRDEVPEESLILLLDEYVRQVDSLEKDYGFNIEICAPVPVEYEARRIPKTGYFEGTPFYGSLEQRQELTQFFIEYIKERKNIVLPPSNWYIIDPELYAKQIMELSSSVHISPTHYRRYNWGL
ncbi:MAG: hypothetical protein HKO92_07075 [Flavobacteriaceae bacterium]|nr:hypothetical protein [Flavobacteriaceae bacterium]